ncbi:MAG: hypothetical protein AAGI38_15835 [Bacteroidota bacterium]
MPKRITFVVFSMLLSIGSTLQAQGIDLYGLWFEKTGGTNSTNLTGYQHLVQVDPNSGTMNSLDTIPGAKFVALGTSTFDNSGNRYVYWGIDTGGVDRIYTIDAPTGNMLSNPAFTQNRPFELEYDLKTGKTYAVEYEGSTRSYYMLEVNL